VASFGWGPNSATVGLGGFNFQLKQSPDGRIDTDFGAGASVQIPGTPFFVGVNYVCVT